MCVPINAGCVGANCGNQRGASPVDAQLNAPRPLAPRRQVTRATKDLRRKNREIGAPPSLYCAMERR